MKGKLRAYIDRKFLFYPKTRQIIELREELFSMMCDKYDDCQSKGISSNDSYNQALSILEDYKTAIREVETGSALGALKKRISSLLAFTALYFVVLAAAYLYVSLVTLGSFEKSWLIGVGGAFIYLVIISVNMMAYAKMFNMPVFFRISLGSLFLSLIPLLFVFPSLLSTELFLTSAWTYNWLIVPVIVLIYLIADLIIFGRKHSRLLFSIELAVAGVILTTVIYLLTSYIYNLWNIAWIVYVVYLAIVALAFYIIGKYKAKITR